jgi:hypothetical protein
MMPLLRTYARGAAVLFVLAAFAGFSGVSMLGGGAPLLYLFTAAIFAYAGSRSADAALRRSVVGGFGTLYLFAGVLLAAAFVALGFPFEGRGYVETLGLAAFGGASSVCARVLPCEDDPPEYR